MIIECPKCKKQYNVDGSKVTEQGVKITCPACQHQFIVRRKQEEKKPEPKKPKTPPCAICGQPSTHVLRGNPPRPLCEHHYSIEKEKETRFFEKELGFETSPSPGSGPVGDPGATKFETTSSGSAAAEASASPAATRLGPEPPGALDLGPPPEQTKSSTPPPTPKHIPASITEPAFESFDDDFDFVDTEAPPPQASPTAESEDEIPLAAPHEFYDMLDKTSGQKPAEPASAAEGLTPSHGGTEPPDVDFNDFGADKSPETKESVPQVDPFQPEKKDLSGPAAAPDPFRADSMDKGPAAAAFSARPDKDQGPKAATADETETPKPPKPETFNLDGTPVDNRYTDREEQEEGFVWESRPDESSPSLTTDLDDEISKVFSLSGPDAAKGLGPRTKAPGLYSPSMKAMGAPSQAAS